MIVEICGDGDSVYTALYENTRQAIVRNRIIARIQVRDRKDSDTHRVNPALYIDETLVCAGRVATVEEIEGRLLKK